MIQRIQSLWLLIVAIAAFLTFTLTLYIGTTATGAEIILPVADKLLLAISITAIGLLALVSIFLFKNRMLQFKLTILGVFLSIGYLFLEYLLVENFKAEKLIASGAYRAGALVPVVMFVFFLMAARGIYRDEKLVKSLNRLR